MQNSKPRTKKRVQGIKVGRFTVQSIGVLGPIIPSLHYSTTPLLITGALVTGALVLCRTK